MSNSQKTRDATRIRALTIRQPFPELILRRRKPYEIRSWRTNYRGPLVIHSAARIKTDCAKESGLKPETLVTSAFVGVVVLSDVRPYTRADSKLLNQKRAIGGWSTRSIFLGTEKADTVCSSDQGKRKAWTVHSSSFSRETRAAALAKAEDKDNRRRLSANHTKSLRGSETSKPEQDASRTVESRTQGVGNAAAESVQVGK
jgi:hypothetical protein